ncbi:DUF523 domain-containing protein [Hathewaya massiliensis]|uniref:DUF523 domain-containing protein n=1 Tax=Hathewaya massiliensis TaxID=1964382 RepID=UPI00115AAC0F|nr:DUF523 domain-containing protein [Hathewaya massiliensis]
MILVSACLYGVNCKYNGENNYLKELKEILKEEEVVLVCPEEIGGMSTPREPSEIVRGTGEDVLKGRAKVISKSGKDCSENFLKGAHKTLEIAKNNNCKLAILKAKSPSCGYGEIYDGNFNGNKILGNGVTAELLIKNGIKVFTEKNIKEFLKEYKKNIKINDII